MAWDINRVILIGRLTTDIDLRYTPNGAAVGKFGLAVGGRPRPDGTETVSFFNVVIWGKSAENCSSYISKGQQVCIDGRLEQRRWKMDDGQSRSTIDVVAERIEFLAKPAIHSQPSQQPSSSGRKISAANRPQEVPEHSYDAGDLDPLPPEAFGVTGEEIFGSEPIDDPLNF